MTTLERIYFNKKLQHELSYFDKEHRHCHDIDNVNLVFHKKKLKKRKKTKMYEHTQMKQPTVTCVSGSRIFKCKKQPKKHLSLQQLNITTNSTQPRVSSLNAILKKKQTKFNSKYLESLIPEQCNTNSSNPFTYPRQVKWKVYRCQLGSAQDACCCSCNSDAMFEVMKSLYDCYKKKNCDNCNCILCGHKPLEERRKSEVGKLLDGKSPEEKEKILKDIATSGKPLPEGRTPSEKKIIEKVRADLGLPPEPKTKAMKEKHAKAAKMGLLQPLEGKTPEEKEKILRGLADLGIPLPEGRTASEKALVAKVKGKPGKVSVLLTPSEKMRKAKAAGLLTPITGKPPAEKERILKGLAMQGIPLPEGKTSSEKKIIDKVRAELGLPPEPTTPEMRDKHKKAAEAGLLQPLEGKTPKEKERILQGLHDLGIPLPEGRTPSEQKLVAAIRARKPAVSLEGKTPEEKEKIVRDLAQQGLPLPEGKTPSEKKLIDKIRKELGLPPDPTTVSMKGRHAQAAEAGLLQPLEGKTPEEKEKILQGLHDMGIPLPEGRTPSEKKLVAAIKARPRRPPVSLEGKTPKEKEKIIRDLAKQGAPLPEAKTPSEKKLIDKIRQELGLPPDPTTASMKGRHAKAADAGLLQPLEGKTPKEKEKILRGLHKMGIPLPEGRTPSEKALVAAIQGQPRAPSAVTLTGKTPAEKEKVLKGLAKRGLPLPEGKTPSEKQLIKKVRDELGLPPEPDTPAMREKHVKAAAAGLLQPLEGKTAKEKEKILQGLHDMGIPLPEGRTPSEKALVAAVKARPRKPSALLAPSEKMRRAKAAGFITPLTGKSPAEKEKIIRGLANLGLPLPEGKTPSEKKLIDKVRADLGLPPEPTTPAMREKYAKAAEAGLLQPLEGKTPKEKEKILQGLHDMGIPLPEGRTPSEKDLIAAIKAKPRAPSAVTLTGKTPKEKEKIVRDLAKQGVPIPEGKTPSEKKMIDKVRRELGLPPDPTTASMKGRHAQAAGAGLLQPLEGKTPEEKERILQGLHDMGIPLPEGRTPSEKKLVAAIKAKPRRPPVSLEGKTPKEKEKIIRDLAKQGLPLPEGKTPSEKQLIDKIRQELGLPPDPTTASMKGRHAQAAEAGLLQPLEGKTPQEKERILQGLHDMGIPLPEGRTPSEKALVNAIKAKPRRPPVSLEGKTPKEKEKIIRDLAKQGVPLPEGKTPSEKKLIDKIRQELGLPPDPTTVSMKGRHAQAADAGLLQPLEGKTPEEKERILQGLHDLGIPLPEGRTPSEKKLVAAIKAKPRRPPVSLEGKTPKEKEKIIRDLAKQGVPLPEGKTPSEKQLIDKIRQELGLPPDPTTASMKGRHAQAADAGLLQPLEGKTPKEKERILQGLHDMGIPLPEGRTPSEKALVAAIKAKPRRPPVSLEGKTPKEKEKIIRDLAKQGVPLPEGKTPSEKKLIEKIRQELGLPPDPTTASMKGRHVQAADAGLLQPLEGKTPKEKERILQGLHDLGIPLPEGRTPSEKALVAAIKAKPRRPPVSLEGKTPKEKEKIIRDLAKQGVPLPEAKTPSEKKLIDKIRQELGLPPDPTTASMKGRHAQAADAGLLQPLEGKTPKEKERILQGLHDMGIPLPEGRTPSEKALIAAIKAKPRAPSAVTLTGKTPAEKEKVLKGLAKRGLPLPEGKTPSEKQLIKKVRDELGLPPEPDTPAMREKHAKAAEAGLLQPLEGKTTKEKEKILQGLHDMGIPLPEGRTPSEKALIASVKARPRKSSALLAPSEKMRRAKAAGLITPLTGKSPAEKEKIIRGLANLGLPLPESKTPSDKLVMDKVRADLGLPPEPTTPAMREKYAKAAEAGLLRPLEGKTPKEKERILQGLHDMGIPLPEGRTPSEKKLIAAITAKPRKPSAVTLTGKTPKEKEKIVRDLAKQGVPLPEGKTPSEKKLIDKIRQELGLPPDPTTASMKGRHAQAAEAGFLQPLEGKTPQEKERILQGLHDLGIPLPEGRTPSEKKLVAAIKAKPRRPPVSLEGKTPKEKEKIIRDLAKQGVPLPEGKTPSEKKLIDKIRKELGLPPDPTTISMKGRHAQAAEAGLLQPLEGKTPKEKERILQGLHDMGIPLPEGRTPSEKALVAAIKAKPRAPSAVTLTGKTPAEKEKVLKGLAKRGLPLPEGKTPSEKQLIKKVRDELGLPPEPDTPAMREKHAKAAEAGLLQPLEGKTPKEKERILQGLHDMGIPLPEGRTPSEKALVASVKARPRKPSLLAPSEKMRRAKAAGLITPLTGKSPAEKEKIIKGLANLGLPLPEGKTPSEKKLINKVRAELGLPPEPETPAMREKHAKAAEAGLLQPLEGKTPQEKERILQGLHDMGIPLPEGRTPSEKALVASVKARPRKPSLLAPSEKMRRAKAAGLITPLTGKSPAEKEKIIKGLANLGLPLPEGKTPSEKKLINKVRAELGLPPEPETPAMREKHAKAAEAGLLQPLEGKTPQEKERILQGLHDMGIPLPEGRTPSEKALVASVKARPRKPSLLAPSEKMRRAKAAGLITPLTGKSPAEKEKIIKGLANLGLPLPEGKTPSEKKLINKVRGELGLPPEPDTPAMREKHAKAAEAGLLQPLEGKTPQEKERILQGLHDMGIPLPEGRTPSEKDLIAAIKAKPRAPSAVTLTGKTPKEKEKIVRDLAKQGLPLPEGKTASEKKMIDKVRRELGLPPEAGKKAPSITTEKIKKAKEDGLFTPLTGKSPEQKEKILRGLAKANLPLPEGKTASEKALIDKIKKEFKIPDKTVSEKLRKAKVAGLLTPLEGKTPAQKEKILRGRVAAGLPLPVGQTASEKALIQKIKDDTGYVTPARIPSEKIRAAGVIPSLKGKSHAEKEKILKGLAEAGLPLPKGETPSEKSLINKIKAQYPTGPVKTKSRKVGDVVSKKKHVSAEEFEDIIKTTKCDRGCGCDKKKIRFKHSYVKIRVTSPDIASLCPCPDECVPGVKAGAFIDNEGIKVTVGSAVGVPSYSSEIICKESPEMGTNEIPNSKQENIVQAGDKPIGIVFNNTNKKKSSNIHEVRSYEIQCSSNEINNYIKTASSLENHNTLLISHRRPIVSDRDYTKKKRYKLYFDAPSHEKISGEPSILVETPIFESSGDFYKNHILKDYMMTDNLSPDSSDTVIYVKSETSLSLNTSSSSSSLDTISVLSSYSGNASYSSSPYYGNQLSELSDDLFSNDSSEESDVSISGIYDPNEAESSIDNSINEAPDDDDDVPSVVSSAIDRKEQSTIIKGVYKQDLYQIFQLTEIKTNPRNEQELRNILKTKHGEPIVVINHLNNERDITNMVDEILTNNAFSGVSSIFLVVPSVDNDAGTSSDGHNSTVFVQANRSPMTWRYINHATELDITKLKSSTTTQHGVSTGKANKFLMAGLPMSLTSLEHKVTTIEHKDPKVKEKDKENTKNKLCQITTPTEKVRIIDQKTHGVNTDTTIDRPCCCHPKPTHYSSNDRCVANITSKQTMRLLGLKVQSLRMPKSGVKQRTSVLRLFQPGALVSQVQVPVHSTILSCPHVTNAQPNEETANVCPCPCVCGELCSSEGQKKEETACIHNDTYPDYCTNSEETDMKEANVKKGVKTCKCNPEQLKELLEQVVKATNDIQSARLGLGVKQARQKPQKQVPKIEQIQEHQCNTKCEQQATKMYEKQVPKIEQIQGHQCNTKCEQQASQIYEKQVPKIEQIQGHQCNTKCEQQATQRLEKQGPITLDTQPTPGDPSRSGDCFHRYNPPPDACGCSTSKNPTKIQPKCPCELYLKTEPITECVPQMEPGPAGEIMDVETGETYALTCNKQAKFSSTIGTCTDKRDCGCKTKKIWKKVACECPEPEPETPPEPEPINDNEKMNMKSAETSSGFKIFRKKRPPPQPKPEYTIDDAIRYYATMKPELFNDIFETQFKHKLQQKQELTAKEKGEKEKKDGKKSNCGCVLSMLNLKKKLKDKKKNDSKKSKKKTEFRPPPPPPPSTTTHASSEATTGQLTDDGSPLGGLKIYMGGKGSGSPGLTGFCCFDLLEEPFTAW